MEALKTEELQSLPSSEGQRPTQIVTGPENNGVVLPKQLEGIIPASSFPHFRHRWNTNEEIASLLISFDHHKEWLQSEVMIRPSSGSMLLYSRNKARYRKDGYCWKKRKDGKNIREDHMKLKVQGLECIYGSYVHSDILPTFHRRCYWLLQNPDIVLVHYLNVPYPDNTKVKIPMMPSCTLEKKEWTKEDLVDQLKPMFSTGRTDEESEKMIDETVEALVRHLIEYHENSKRIAKDRMDQNKLQDSMSHSSLQIPQEETRGDTTFLRQTVAQASNVSNSQNLQFSAALVDKTPEHRNSDGKSAYIVHHKASNHDPRSDLDLKSACDMPQGPFILSLDGHLNIPTSNYVVVNGQSSPITTPVSVNALCQSIDAVPPNVVISNQTFNSTSPHFIQSVGKVIQPKNLVNNIRTQSATTGKCCNCNCSVQVSSQIDSASLHNEAKNAKQNLVPQLQNVTAVDVQNVILSQNDMEKSGGSPNVEGGDNFNDSIGSSDFDNLDLELPDLDKLCSILGSTVETNSSNQHSVTSAMSNTKHICNLGSQCQGHCHGFHGSDQSYSSHGGKSMQLQQNDQSGGQQIEQNKVDIVDISPEWSYEEGGSKLLVIGPWYNSTSQYSCMIDGTQVPTTCIQPGVLRCYTPAHSEGFASLQVSCDGHVISNTVQLEYKVKQGAGNCTQWFNFPEKELKVLLIERLNQLEERLAQSHYRDGPVPSLKQAGHSLVESDDLEGKLQWYIKMFSAGTWNDLDTFPVSNKYSMTLLHLTAALGYNRLIQAILNWRCDNPSWFLDYEVDANSQDINSCTALMWACVRGHEEAAVALYHWNTASLKIRNKQGLSPLDLAQENGHICLYDRLTKLQQEISFNSPSIISGEFPAAGSVENLNPFPTVSLSHDPLLSNGRTTISTTSDCDLFKSPAPVYSQTKGTLDNLFIDIPPNTMVERENLLLRRQSDQALMGGVKSKRKLSKRLSIDVPSQSDDNRSSRAGSCDRPIREANSEPHLSMTTITDPLTRAENPMLSSQAHTVSSPDSLLAALQDSRLTHLHHEGMMGRDNQDLRMDTDEVLSTDSGSPIIDVEKVSSDEETSDQIGRSERLSVSTDSSEEAKQQMVTLAKQIIAAIPERIKYSPSRGDDFIIDTTRERSSSYSSVASQPSPHASSYGEDSGISTPMGDSFAFEEYRYPDINTPASSLSPESTCLPSPYSPYSFTLDSPPPTTAEFTEYFNAPATFMEKDFSQLTLSDQEQRRLYEAAKVIQKTYRQYRDKQQLQQQQQKEIYAAILIQKYYRRYKQYAYYKKMTQAAVLIQSQFRSYYAQKRFKKSRDAAVVIQNQYRTYKEHERLKKGGNKSVIIQQRYRSHYQRKNFKGQSSEGHVVQIVPESAESSPQDPNSQSTDISSHHDDDVEPPTGENRNQGETTP